jgi:hypothetical protein
MSFDNLLLTTQLKYLLVISLYSNLFSYLTISDSVFLYLSFLPIILVVTIFLNPLNLLTCFSNYYWRLLKQFWFFIFFYFHRMVSLQYFKLSFVFPASFNRATSIWPRYVLLPLYSDVNVSLPYNKISSM